MRRFAYGRRHPAPRPARAVRAGFVMAGALDALGSAPAESNDYVAAAAGRFGSFDNENIGDCVEADTANSLILRTANAGAAVVPTLQDVISLYSAVGGYQPGNAATDNGTEVQTMCDHLVSIGFLGHKAQASGPVDHTNLDHVRWAQKLFGVCRLGWNLPGYAEDLFLNGRPWDVSASGDQSIAGHDTALVDFRGGLLYVVSWYDSAAKYDRKLVPVTPAFALRYLEEAHAELFPEWIAAQGQAPSGFDMAGLMAKLREVA